MRSPIHLAARVGRFTLAGAFALTLLPAGAGAHATLHRHQATDLGAALLLPADVAELGFEDYGIDVGRNMSYTQTQHLDSVLTDGDLDEIDDHGVQAILDLNLAPIDGTDGTASFYSNIAVFDTAAHARADYESVVEGAENDDATEVIDDDLDLLDGGIVYVQPINTDDGGTAEGTLVSFRYDNLDVLLVLSDRDEAVDADVAIAAAETVANKLEEIVESGEINGEPVPGLTMATPRYEDNELAAGRSHYTVINGEVVPYAHDLGTNQSQPDVVRHYGMVSQYTSNQEYVLDDVVSLNDPLVQTRVATFEDEDGAEEFVLDRIQTLEHTPNADNVEEIDLPDGAYAGGAVVAATFDGTWDGVTFATTRIWAQDGTRVYYVSVTGFESLPVDTLLQVLNDFLDCGQSGCTSTVEPPADLMDFFAEQRDIWLNEMN